MLAALADDDVTEVYVNAGDGLLRADTHTRGKVALDATVRGDQVEQFLGVVAASRGDTLGATAPSVQAELPAETFGGARLQGFVPPPSFPVPASSCGSRPAACSRWTATSSTGR